MPSIRKRIGYLPRPNVHELIIMIANEEKLSQSKLVGILVEEALLARGFFTPQINAKTLGKVKNINDVSTFNYEDLDEFISDKGISYNNAAYRIKNDHLKNLLSKTKEHLNGELFSQFMKKQNKKKDK